MFFHMRDILALYRSNRAAIRVKMDAKKLTTVATIAKFVWKGLGG